LGCAAILGAAVAFPAGVMFAGHERVREKGLPAASGSRATKPFVRNVYSPTIFHDPYFLDQQRRVVEALEAQCRNQRERCAEAQQARQWVEQQKASE